MNSFGKIATAIGVILALFFVPTLILSLQAKAVDESHVNTVTEEFVNRCRSSGYISAGDYLSFCRDVSSTGVYKIDIQYQKKVAYPDLDSVGNPTGDAEIGYISLGNKDVLEYMFPDDISNPTRDFKMDVGDVLFIRITRESANAGIRLMYQYLGIDLTKTIARHGGQVGQYLGE